MLHCLHNMLQDGYCHAAGDTTWNVASTSALLVQVYNNILNVPMRVARSADDMGALIRCLIPEYEHRRCWRRALEPMAKQVLGKLSRVD